MAGKILDRWQEDYLSSGRKSESPIQSTECSDENIEDCRVEHAKQRVDSARCKYKLPEDDVLRAECRELQIAA